MIDIETEPTDGKLVEQARAIPGDIARQALRGFEAAADTLSDEATDMLAVEEGNPEHSAAANAALHYLLARASEAQIATTAAIKLLKAAAGGEK